MTQSDTLRDAELSLELGPVALAREMGVPYPTYKDWKNGRNPMPAVAYRCLELLAEVRASGCA